ncbi:cytosine permease [Microbacterium sp. LWH7-1.2]|uniref:purine-cytosine permease family protein n=1 Tax=Microbacterium sp. LWH7-1.2 TaxID=3135257 RepID=UPI0031392D08
MSAPIRKPLDGTGDASSRQPTPPTKRTLAETAEDHALVSVPAEHRQSGWQLSLSTIGVVTALVIFAIAGFSVILAGFWNAFIGGLIVGAMGFILGDLLGRMAHRTGVSSTITARYFGLGFRGSALAAGIFAFMVLGFLALESSLLYEGTLVAFGWDDTWVTKIGVYAVLTIAWILLAIFGLRLALRASGILIVITLVVAVIVAVQNFTSGGATWEAVFTTPGIVPGGAWAQIEAVVALAGATGAAVALVTTDMARFARTRRDVTILAASGPAVQSLVMSVLGAVVVVAAMPTMIQFLMAQQPGLTVEEAAVMAGGYAMGNTGAFFVVVAGWLGFVTIFAAQAKAQAMNAYSGSLALVNLVQTVTNRRVPRAAMVIVGNIIALIMIGAGILGSFVAWLAYLGAITFSLCGVMIADYYIVRRGKFDRSTHRIESFNWAGIITLVGAAVLGIVLMVANIWPLGFLASFAATIVVYPILRRILPEGTGTAFTDEKTALTEA